MSIQIAPLTKSHIPQAARTLLDAFQDDPSVRVIFEGFGEDEQARFMRPYFLATLGACLRRGWPLAALDGDRVVAAATVYPPGAYPPPRVEGARMIFNLALYSGPFRRNTWTVLKRMEASSEGVEKLHPERPHYYLEWVGVKPECQGRGIGSALFRAILERADQDRVGCYLETEKARNLPLYDRLGFRVFSEEENLGVKTWFLWREPAAFS